MEYKKEYIREYYKSFVDYIRIIDFDEGISEIKFLFRPDIKKLTVISVRNGKEHIVEEFVGFGLTPFKELLSAANKSRRDTSKLANIKFVMELI